MNFRIWKYGINHRKKYKHTNESKMCKNKLIFSQPTIRSKNK